jgi:hypothetical protein
MALSRPRDSGSEELMESLVMRGARRGVFPPQTRVSEMGEVIERVARNVNALGYSVFYFERFRRPIQKTSCSPSMVSSLRRKLWRFAPTHSRACVVRHTP